MNDIMKIRYTANLFDVEKMTMGRKEIYEISSDGKVVLRCYNKGNSRCLSKKEFFNTIGADFNLLCAKLIECISTADRLNEYIDDTTTYVSLYYTYGRVDKMPRGYGTEKWDVGSIISEYLTQIKTLPGTKDIIR